MAINCCAQGFILILRYRGTQFNLSREELLTLPEFVLLSLFPNGLFPDGGSGSFHEDVYSVDVRIPNFLLPCLSQFAPLNKLLKNL